jgi:hypothetical protein
MVEATFRKTMTGYRVEEAEIHGNHTNGTSFVQTVMHVHKYKTTSDGVNVLGMFRFNL